MTKVFNKSKEKRKRKMLRNNMPRAEAVLWSKLKQKQLGHKFRRQYSVDTFVIDFYCPKLKLAIEVDGNSHYKQGAQYRDKERQKLIESYGISFIRYTNKDVLENLDGVLSVLTEYIKRLTT